MLSWGPSSLVRACDVLVSPWSLLAVLYGVGGIGIQGDTGGLSPGKPGGLPEFFF